MCFKIKFNLKTVLIGRVKAETFVILNNVFKRRLHEVVLNLSFKVINKLNNL